MNERCGACGTPKSKNDLGQLDCPKCNSEYFVGISKKKEISDEIIEQKITANTNSDNKEEEIDD